MATSGTVLGNKVNISGSKGARLRIEWQLAGQNIGGNFSTINWQAYIDFDGADAQLDNGHVYSNVGTLYNNGGRVYNYAGNFSNHTVGMGAGSFNIGHDGGGNAGLSLSGDVAVYQSGTTSGGGSWSLPTIPRYANITFFDTSVVTDEKIVLNWGADNNCDYISWWSVAYDGGAHHDMPASGAGFAVTLNNLLSDKTYDFRVAVRRADSGLWTESGTIIRTTLKQNNFFSFRVP